MTAMASNGLKFKPESHVMKRYKFDIRLLYGANSNGRMQRKPQRNDEILYSSQEATLKGRLWSQHHVSTIHITLTHTRLTV